MKCVDPVRLILVLLTITWASSLPTKESTTRRPSQPQIGETIKQLTSQLMNANSSTADLTLDTRTPPKVKQQMKKPPKKEVEVQENSHPGIAVPVEDADLIFEESTKKFNFYKIENKPTTDRGLSTWVLLNSQTVSPSSSTTKTSRKPIMKQKEETKNLTAVDAEIFNKMTKPLFKKRPLSTTTKKPTTTTTKASTLPEKEHKLTKVKASILNNAINSKNKTETTVTKKHIETTTSNVFKKENSLEAENMLEISTVSNKISTSLTTTNGNAAFSIESKEDDAELPTTTSSSKKTRRPTTKRKKNKNRRRRPTIDKSDTNSTKVANKIKEKPISTQIYNYLSREIMPTVGVGLVGLMVTAGLASYFLYPFGAVRRSYEAIDRKDKEGTYYYSDEYAPGGVAEEEVIGQVIAGMPANSNYGNYRSPSSSGLRHKQSDFGFRKAQAQSSSDAIYLTPSRKYGEDEDTYVGHRSHKPEFYNPQRTYNKDVIEHSQETSYTVDEKQFVVGNVPKEIQEATPVAVPEHGPRQLPEVGINSAPQGLSDIVAEHAPRSMPEIFTAKLRKRRSNEKENEIFSDDDKDDNDDTKNNGNNHPIRNKKKNSSKSEVSSPKPESTTAVTKRPQSFMNSLTNLFEDKIRMGLEWLQNTSRAISRYLAEVHRRFNNKMKASSKEQPRMH